MIKLMNMNSNVNFKAKLNVDITDEYLDKLKNSPRADVYSAKLLQGLKLLEKTAPMIGTDSDTITLSNKVPKDRPFFQGTDRLLLNFNNEHYKIIDETNYASNIQKAMSDLFSNVMEDESRNVHYRHSDNAEATISKIKSFNTVA